MFALRQVHTAAGETFVAKHVIVTIPQTLLNRVMFIPPLPLEKFQLIQRIPMGCVIKAAAYYEKPYWKQRQLSTTRLVSANLDDPVWYSLDDTKPDGSAPCLLSFIVANQVCVTSFCTTKSQKKSIKWSLHVRPL